LALPCGPRSRLRRNHAIAVFPPFGFIPNTDGDDGARSTACSNASKISGLDHRCTYGDATGLAPCPLTGMPDRTGRQISQHRRAIRHTRRVRHFQPLRRGRGLSDGRNSARSPSWLGQTAVSCIRASYAYETVIRRSYRVKSCGIASSCLHRSAGPRPRRPRLDWV